MIFSGWRAAASDLVNFVYLVNLVRNLPFRQLILEGDAGSHKVHQEHKVHKPDRCIESPGDCASMSTFTSSRHLKLYKDS